MSPISIMSDANRSAEEYVRRCNSVPRFTVRSGPTEAESAARRSVDLDGTNYRARSLLAVALVEQGKLTSEVEKSLRHAADDLPAAHLLLGKVFIATGRLEDAEGELRSYLASGHPRERSTVQAWMQKHEATGRAAGRRVAGQTHSAGDRCVTPETAQSKNTPPLPSKQ